MPEHFAEITRVLPMPHLHRRNAPFNLATRVPTEFQTVDLGPKLYIAHGTHDGPGSAGTTPLHLDMTDAVNLMLRSSAPSGGHASVGDDSERAGALWHIFDPASAPLLRAFITKVAAERGLRVDDSIHDQRWYLDRDLLARLASEHGVLPWRVLQRPGDAIFIPAGCPHQVCNLQDCIKIAMDFVSPHNIDQSLRLTDEFRRLSSTHQRKSDLLHPKSIIYYAWRSCMDAAAARSASAASAASASLASPESAPMASPLASTESPMPSSSQTCNAVPGDAIASVKSESVLGGGGVGGEGESHMDLDDPSPASSDAAAVPADHAIDTKTMPASDLDKRGCNSSGEYCDDEMANSCLVDIDVVG
nr:putative JmjC domain-containing histone demethylation protein 2C [Polyrhizophydium stewartii]